MDLSNPLSWAIIACSFLSAVVSSVFGIGGGFIMLALVANILPLADVVPMQSALVMGLSMGRSWYFRHHTQWTIVTPFVVGCFLGAPLGAVIYVHLPGIVIGLVLGGIMLASVWLPPLKWRVNIRHPFLLVGIFHSLLSTLFSFGGLLQPVMLRTSLGKMQIIATLSVALMIMNVLKLASYVAVGFNFKPYLALIALSIATAIPGAALGRRLVHRVPDEKFRMIFKLIITLLALRLCYRAWMGA